MHALVFWGFVVLILQVIMLFGRTFDAGWDIPGFGPDQPLGPPFFLARDLLELIVIVGVELHALPAADRRTPRGCSRSGAPSSATATPRTGRAS